MKKIGLSILILLTLNLKGQNCLFNFSEPFYECVDRWVALKGDDADTTPVVGFVYLDLQAGFTFNYEGRLRWNSEHKLQVINDIDNTGLKIRIPPTWAPMAPLSESQLSEANLPAAPDWLATYKKNDDPELALLITGWYYNQASGGEHLAIAPLEELWQKNPGHEGVAFELSYAYNATKQYDKAKLILTHALETDHDFSLYRELGYACLGLDQPEEAEEAFKKGIMRTDLDEQRAEMATNMALYYLRTSNLEKYQEWRNTTLKYTHKGTNFYHVIEQADASIKSNKDTQ